MSAERPKISIIGAGNTGEEMAALAVAKFSPFDLVLVDPLPRTRGKALDLAHLATMYGNDVTITAVDITPAGLEATTGSDIIINTAGVPRKPGEPREALIGKTWGNLNMLIPTLARLSPNMLKYIGFTNPMDEAVYMAYLLAKPFGLKPHQFIGQGGILDTSRFCYAIGQVTNAKSRDINCLVIGAHTEANMVPLVSQAKVRGQRLREFLSPEAIEQIVQRTKNGGAEVLKLMGDGSAKFAPALATIAMVNAILYDDLHCISASVYLTGEYGINDVFVGAPVSIAGDGYQIEEIDIDEDELAAFRAAAETIRRNVEIAMATG